VLQILIDDLRFCGAITFEDERLTHQTPVRTLRNAYGAPTLDDLAMTLNRALGISVPRRDWRAVLQPAHVKTVGDVCDFIAARAVIPAIEPREIGGDHSAAAGAFLAVRETLDRAGINVSGLTPSTPLEPFLREHVRSLYHLNHLAPGRLPTPQIVAPVHAGLSVAASACGFAALTCHCFGAWPSVEVLLMVTAAVCWVSLFVAGWAVRPARVQLSWLKDFRDLSRVLAGEREGGWPGFEVVAQPAPAARVDSQR
jgi:hypothetical protein